MKLKTWLVLAGGILLGLLPTILKFLSSLVSKPSTADSIVSTADVQKEKIHEEIVSDSDAALASKFNSSVKKEGGK